MIHWLIFGAVLVMDRLVVTGANGNLGRRLLRALQGRCALRALVRSERAAARLRSLRLSGDTEILVVDYLDVEAMGSALADAVAVVHLVGIIKEPAVGAYREAHEETCEVLAAAASQARVERIVYLSILGAHPQSSNACLASKGRAEAVLLEKGPTTRVFRVPMVLGEGDYASLALARRARRRVSFTFRAASLEQPLYAGDLVAAIVATLDDPQLGAGVVELAGPESLPRGALIQRAARCLGRSTRVISLPVGIGFALAWLLERTTSKPPVTRAMLGVLDHDDALDTASASRALGLSLTGLDAMLATCLTASERDGYST